MPKPLIIITGASAGIGATLANLFSAAGYPLGLISRNLKALQALQLPNTLYLAADITDYDALKQTIHTAEQTYGPVDCLINNAGYAQFGDFSEQTHDSHERTVQTNLIGVINGIDAVLPGMRARKKGTIINISSLADRKARPLVSVYAATKAAVKSLSESLRMANAQYGIRICNVAPAKVQTAMVTKNVPENQIMSIESLANTVRWIYEQPQEICIRDIVMASTFYEA